MCPHLLYIIYSNSGNTGSSKMEFGHFYWNLIETKFLKFQKNLVSVWATPSVWPVKI